MSTDSKVSHAAGGMGFTYFLKSILSRFQRTTKMPFTSVFQPIQGSQIHVLY